MAKNIGHWINKMWRDTLLSCAEDAIAFFMPDLEEQRDTSQPIGLQDNQLSEIDSDSDKGERIADVIFSVPLKSGEIQFVTFIVEQQHEIDRDFGARMLTEYLRASDRFKFPVTMLAIFTGPQPSADHYEADCFGTKLSFEFRSYVVADADARMLKADPSSFAPIVLAALRMLEANGDPTRRVTYARELIALMRERNYDMERRKNVLLFVRRALRLKDKDIDKNAKEEFNLITATLERAKEQAAKEALLEEGRQEGLQEGMQKGMIELAKKLLTQGVAPEIITSCSGMSIDEINALT